MAAEAFLREHGSIAALILMGIMAGCTIHITIDKAFTAFN
jgi:hypothetical protein